MTLKLVKNCLMECSKKKVSVFILFLLILLFSWSLILGCRLSGSFSSPSVRWVSQSSRSRQLSRQDTFLWQKLLNGKKKNKQKTDVKLSISISSGLHMSAWTGSYRVSFHDTRWLSSPPSRRILLFLLLTRPETAPAALLRLHLLVITEVQQVLGNNSGLLRLWMY